jgi:hypothetical protein
VKATRHRLQDPVLEAAALVGRERWESTRAELFEGPSVTVLVSPRRGPRDDASDVWVTVVVTTDTTETLDDVAVTLEGPSEGRYARLDRRGRCVVTDVLDASYRLGLCRVAEVHGPADQATLPLPAECLGDCPRWTSADGSLTATRLSDDWRRVRVEAEAPRQVTSGRVVDGRLDLRSVALDRAPGSDRPTATLEFESAGPPDVVCLPLPRR